MFPKQIPDPENSGIDILVKSVYDSPMPPFNCETASVGDVYVVRSTGYLDEKGGVAVRKAVDDAFQKGFQKFALNFSGSPVINSPGIAQLLELSEVVVDERKGQLVFCGLNELTMGVFKMVGLLSSGKAYPNEDTAIKSLKG